MQDNNILHFKMVLLGDTAVGKSCLASRFIGNDFLEFQEPTIGAAFLTKQMIFENNKIKFDIWDTAGQERYRSLAPMYYRGAHIAIVVFDITCLDSFNSSKNWISEILRRTDESIIIALIGNKKDLENNRTVTKSLIENYLNDNNQIIYLETSAKTNENIDELFDRLLERLPKNSINNRNINNRNISISSNKYKKIKCCN